MSTTDLFWLLILRWFSYIYIEGEGGQSKGVNKTAIFYDMMFFFGVEGRSFAGFSPSLAVCPKTLDAESMEDVPLLKPCSLSGTFAPRPGYAHVLYVRTNARNFPRFFRQTVHCEEVISKRLLLSLFKKQRPSPALTKLYGNEREFST